MVIAAAHTVARSRKSVSIKYRNTVPGGTLKLRENGNQRNATEAAEIHTGGICVQPEHPAIYILRFVVAALGEIVLAGFLYWMYVRLLQWGNLRERELLGRRSIPQDELRHMGYLSLAVREGQATFATPRLIAIAGFAAGFSLVLIPPLVHLLYTLAITILNVSFMTGAPVDPRLPVAMYPWPVFRDNILTIAHYLPFLLLMGIAYGIFTIGFAVTRRRMTVARIHWQFLGIDLPGSWLVGIPLGALFYFLAGALSNERTLGWLLSQYIIWAVAAYAIPLYLHRMEDTLLYWFTRFDWEGRTAAAVRYILLDRFAQPSPVLVQTRGTDGFVLVDAELLPQDAPVFTGLVAQLPGVEKVELRIGGQPAGNADGGKRNSSVLREAAALRGERRQGHAATDSQEDEEDEAGRSRISEGKKEIIPSRRGVWLPVADVETRPAIRPGRDYQQNTLAVQLVLFFAGVLLLGGYFYGPGVVRHFWPERVFGPAPPTRLPAGLEATADIPLLLPHGGSPATLTITPGGLMALLDSNGRLWTWPNAGQALAQVSVETPIQPELHLLALPAAETITHLAPAPDGRLLAATKNDSRPADGLQTLVWIDPDAKTRTDLPQLSHDLLPAANADKIRLARLAVDHDGRPYATVAVRSEDSTAFLVLGLFGNRWQVIFTGPALLDLIPSYQNGLPLIALTGEPPSLRRLGYRRESPFGLRGDLPQGKQWTSMAITAERYLTLSGPEGTLIQIAPDGYPIAQLETRVGNKSPTPAESSPATPQVLAWADPDTMSEWVGIFSQGHLSVYQPDSVGRLVRLAYGLEAKNQIVPALAIWKNVLRSAPELPQAHIAVGKAHFEEGDWRNAAKEFYLAGDQEWLGRALVHVDSQVRRTHLLPLLLGGVALMFLSGVTSFLDLGRRGVQRMSELR